MATLDLTYDELRRQVGRYLGYDRTPSNWDTTVAQDVEDILKSGLRMFYYPPNGYIWSFLKQVGTLTTESGEREYDLPTDFAAITDEFSFATNLRKLKIEGIAEASIRQMYSNAETSSAPHYYAVRARASGDGARTAHQVLFYPVPDSAYVLKYRYLIEPLALSVSNIYPLGGALHSETIMEACLASAEKTLNPESVASRGGFIHMPLFDKHLAGSVAIDQTFA